jgi:hypothetical protein
MHHPDFFHLIVLKFWPYMHLPKPNKLHHPQPSKERPTASLDQVSQERQWLSRNLSLRFPPRPPASIHDSARSSHFHHLSPSRISASRIQQEPASSVTVNPIRAEHRREATTAAQLLNPNPHQGCTASPNKQEEYFKARLDVVSCFLFLFLKLI